MVQYVTEYLVSWLRTNSAISQATRDKIEAYQYLPETPVDSILVFLESYSAPNPNVIPEIEIKIQVTSKALQTAKDRAFEIYEAIRYRFNETLPVPNPIPQNVNPANLEPIVVASFDVGSIQLIGQSNNGEFRYSIDLNLQLGE